MDVFDLARLAKFQPDKMAKVDVAASPPQPHPRR